MMENETARQGSSREPLSTGAIAIGVAVQFGGMFVVGIAFGILAVVSLQGQRPTEEGLVARVLTTPYLVGGALMGGIFSFLGGFIAGRVARHREVFHGLIVGFVALALGVATSIGYLDDLPLWYLLAWILLSVPVSALGGYVARRVREGAAVAPEG